MERRVSALERYFRRVGLWKKDFGYRIRPGTPRWATHVQLMRRSTLAWSRNHLLFHALDDEDWVLWIDVDVIEYPGNIIEALLATGKGIVQPHCILDYGGKTFDQNAWRDHGKIFMDALRTEGDLVPLDAVGGTMLLVKADIHRDGLIFPSFQFGLASPVAAVRIQASAPIPRSPLVMRHGDHFDTAWDLVVNDTVGKLAENVSSSASLEARPNGRRTRDQSKRARRFTNKRLCGLDASLKVPLECVIDLPESFRDKLNPGVAHSVSLESHLGSLPRESSLLPRLPELLSGQRPPGAKPSRHRFLAQALSSPTTHPQSQPAPAQVG